MCEQGYADCDMLPGNGCEINIGTAAHICAAAPGGPRFNAEMSVDERKRAFDIAASAARDKGATIMSCSDQNMDVVIDLAGQLDSVTTQQQP